MIGLSICIHERVCVVVVPRRARTRVIAFFSCWRMHRTRCTEAGRFLLRDGKGLCTGRGRLCGHGYLLLRIVGCGAETLGARRWRWCLLLAIIIANSL